MGNILINQSVAILCDGNNIERSIHELIRDQGHRPTITSYHPYVGAKLRLRLRSYCLNFKSDQIELSLYICLMSGTGPNMSL